MSGKLSGRQWMVKVPGERVLEEFLTERRIDVAGGREGPSKSVRKTAPWKERCLTSWSEEVVGFSLPSKREKDSVSPLVLNVSMVHSARSAIQRLQQTELSTMRRMLERKKATTKRYSAVVKWRVEETRDSRSNRTSRAKRKSGHSYWNSSRSWRDSLSNPYLWIGKRRACILCSRRTQKWFCVIAFGKRRESDAFSTHFTQNSSFVFGLSMDTVLTLFRERNLLDYRYPSLVPCRLFISLFSSLLSIVWKANQYTHLPLFSFLPNFFRMLFHRFLFSSLSNNWQHSRRIPWNDSCFCQRWRWWWWVNFNIRHTNNTIDNNSNIWPRGHKLSWIFDVFHIILLFFDVLGLWSLVSKQDRLSQHYESSTDIIRLHENQENEDIIQTSPVEKDEGILQHKSQSRLKRLERTVTGDRTSQEGTSGEISCFFVFLSFLTCFFLI